MDDNSQSNVTSSGGDDHVKIDADSLASFLYKSMPENLSLSKKRCIFKIPNILRRHNPKAFVPNAFSIGPWHHDQEHLKPAEEIKLNYLKRLTFQCPSPKTKLKELIQAIGEIEEVARAHYAGPIDVSADKFIKLLVIDGCFIIELFRRDFEKAIGEIEEDECDPIFLVASMLQFLFHDLILLENQIPWIVLERLFDLTMDSVSQSLEHLAIRFFSNIFSSEPPNFSISYQGKNHILDLLREWLVSSSDIAEVGKSKWKPMPSAQSLKEDGIKFQAIEGLNILDIKFVDGVLKVPSLLIQETTEDIFRNLISFEQCYSRCRPIITSYAILLGNLIQTEKDMNILCEKKIIDNPMIPEAAQFVNKLWLNTYAGENYYLDPCVKVNAYCSRQWPRWRAWYLHNFSTPWAIASQVLAAVLLILSFLQTLYSIIK